MRAVRTLPLALVAACLGPTLAAAQAPAVDPPDPQAPAESPELRALRLAELEMFRGQQPLAEGLGSPPRLHPPGVVTSDAPGPNGIDLDPASKGGPSWMRGLELPSIPVRWYAAVVRYLDFYRNDPRGHAIMEAWLRRSQTWAPVLKERLRQLHLPEDLMYVAMVESGFDLQARSQAGAVGMWQFVKRTAQEYGLRVDHWVDQRRDPEKATMAGARYLRHLHRRLGSWELALAAYNMGYGALVRAMRKYNTNDYWTLANLEAGLPFETTHYVAKVMACAVVGRNPERFGFRRLGPAEGFEFDPVEVPGGTPLPLIARTAGVAVDELKRLNPSLRRNRTPPTAQPVSFRLPAGSAGQFHRAWPKARPGSTIHRPYVMRFGETLTHVAQRFRTDAPTLRELNALDDSVQLGVGFRLMVPAVEPADPPTPERKPIVAIPNRKHAPAELTRVFYRTIAGDTVEAVARFFKVSVDDLRQWNHIEPHAALPEGLTLQLFVEPEFDRSRALLLAEKDVHPVAVGSEEFFDYHESQRGRVRFRYEVQRGETLSSIGHRFDLSVGSLARINRFARSTEVKPGDRLVVYAPREQVPADVLAKVDARLERAASSPAPKSSPDVPAGEVAGSLDADPRPATLPAPTPAASADEAGPEAPPPPG